MFIKIFINYVTHIIILVFATDNNLQHLANNDNTLYADGTFYIFPSLFTQLYTLHALIDGAMFPLVFVLLPGKSYDIFTRFCNLLKTAYTQRQIHLNPTTFFIDYEVALQNAARTSFPGITIKSCCFHYTQCIWRKVQATGLVINYKDEPEIHRLIRRASVSPLVPQAAIEDVWFHAQEDLENSASTANTTTFTDYVTTHWVENNRHLWNY